MQHAEELVLRAQEVVAFFTRLVSQMDAVLEIDIVSAMQDTKALQQHAGHVLTASTTLAKLEELL